jgi:hypothetical protein
MLTGLRRPPEDRGVLVEHAGQADLTELGRRVEEWLRAKSFETEVLTRDQTCVIRGEAASGLKKAIGASPSLEVELAATATGTQVDVRPGRATGAVWTARFFTYSWVAYGMSFVSVRSALVEFIKAELRRRSVTIQADTTILGVIETTRVEQPLGSEERAIDNSDSDTTITRSIKATKRWTQTCQLEIDKSRVSGLGADLNVANLATLRVKLETTLREQYSASTQVEQVYEEEVTITVPPKTSVHLIMDWKRIIQQGYLQLRDAAGVTVEVPFEVAVGVTFDQRQLSAAP